MRIYVAAPYTLGDPVRNTRDALHAAEMLLAMGHIPYVPHLSLFWHLAFPHSAEFWYAYDLRWLEVCDAIYRLPGKSTGADREVTHARELGLPVYESPADVPRSSPPTSGRSDGVVT